MGDVPSDGERRDSARIGYSVICDADDLTLMELRFAAARLCKCSLQWERRWGDSTGMSEVRGFSGSHRSSACSNYSVLIPLCPAMLFKGRHPVFALIPIGSGFTAGCSPLTFVVIESTAASP